MAASTHSDNPTFLIDQLMRLWRLYGWLLLFLWVASACGRPEDPATVALRARLNQQPQLSSDELTRLRQQVSSAIAGKQVLIRDGASTRSLDEQQRATVLGMLTEPAGMFDEGLRQQSGATFRVLNSPADSANPEIEASRRLMIDVTTFLPRRFEFAYAFAGYGDYGFDLVVR
jgi:hypothetical protein